MIDVCLVYFRATDLRYLDAAFYSIATQSDLSKVRTVYVLDNDTEETNDEILAVLERYPLPEPVRLVVLHAKHGEEAWRCHSWSVNQVMGHVPVATEPCDWALFTRSDYILHRDTVRDFIETADAITKGEYLWTQPTDRLFVTSHAYHHALDERADQRVVGFRDIEQHGWRTAPESTNVLLKQVNGWYVDSSDKDAGVWLTRRSLWREVGGLNEQLTAWGYQQTVFQKALRDAGVRIVQLPRVYFHHQHHGGTFRDYDTARKQLEEFWGSVEALHDFRDVSGHHGAVCDELDPK